MRLLSALLTLALAGSAAAVSAQEANLASAPSRTTATYGDWMVRCEAATDGNKTARTCESVQGISANGGQGLLAQIVIGRPAGENEDHVLVELPPGVSLPEGATLGFGEAKTLPLAFKRCLQSCLADAPLPRSGLDALLAAPKAATLTFHDGAGKPVALPVSLAGLRDAYVAMKAR